MMPYGWCQQSDDCWLRSLFAQSELTDLPRFRLGQIVEIPWTSEETHETRIDRGVIVGFTIADSQQWREPGWIYFIRLTEIPSSPWLPANFIEEVRESDLREPS